MSVFVCGYFEGSKKAHAAHVRESQRCADSCALAKPLKIIQTREKNDPCDFPAHKRLCGATAFEQNLTWCLPSTANTHSAFDLTLCESARCGVSTAAEGACPTASPSLPLSEKHARRDSASSSGGRALVSSVWGRALSLGLALCLIVTALVTRKSQQDFKTRLLEDDGGPGYAPLLSRHDSDFQIIEMGTSKAGLADPFQLQHLIMMVIQLDNCFNVLQWSCGMATVTGSEDPPKGLKFAGLSFRGEADRAVAVHEVTRVMRGGCDPRPFPLWLRASEGLRFVAIVAQCVRSYENSWLIFGNEVEANLLSLMHRAPSVASCKSGNLRGERSTALEEDKDEVKYSEMWDNVSELCPEVSHVTPLHAAGRVWSSRSRSRGGVDECDSSVDHGPATQDVASQPRSIEQFSVWGFESGL